MRTYPYVHIGLAIVFLIVAGTLVCPQDGLAREPEKELVTVYGDGGTSGGGEWKSPPDDPPQLPMDLERVPGSGGSGYSEPRQSAANDSWADVVNAMVIRTVRFVGTTFSELF